jgi:serine/threonine protein kinase
VLLGKFRFEERVGSGGMGVVYRAVDLALGRDVAIKTLPRMSIDYSSRLRREARAMALVSHPNLAIIYGAETWRGTPMLIFEFLDGGTLADRTALQLLRTGEIVDLGIALAGALEQTHAAGILHRDIKPSNIGYTIESVPKLLDFGLAKIVDDSRRRGALSGTTIVARSEDVTRTDSVPGFVSSTDTGGIVGTPLYVSPEAILEERPSPGFDLWSLAIVLYESIAGTNPFRGDSLQDTFRRIVRGRIPDVREFRPDCQEAIAMFLKDALSRSRARRPASAKEFRTRLERVKEVALT